MDKITLKEIAGYATEHTVWLLIKELSTDGRSEWWEPEGQEVDAWTVGAVAFYALMGEEVLGGKGRGRQSATTPIPRVGTTHCSAKLSGLIHRCLSFTEEERPTLEDLRHESEGALAEKPVAPQRLTTTEGRTYKTSLVRFWPEEMAVVLFFLATFVPSVLWGQGGTVVPQEMTDIVRRCVDLRTKGNALRVEEAFTYDTHWTLMDELAVDRKGECARGEKVNILGLNRMACRIVKLNKGVSNSGGRFRDGRDPRYSYSFLEVTARKGSSLNYDITGREGEQLFAILPGMEGARFTAEMTFNGAAVGSQWTEDGVVYIAVEEGVKQEDVLHLKITNLSGKNMSFVIVNYNSRKGLRFKV